MAGTDLPAGSVVTDPRGSSGRLSRFLPFEVVQEPWVSYSLSDGTRLRVRFVLLKLIQGEPVAPGGMKSAGVASQVLVVVESPDELRGPPGAMPASDQMSQAVEAEVMFDAPPAVPSVYRFDQNRTIVVETRLVKVSRTRLIAPDGDRIYQVETTAQVVIMGGTPEAKPQGEARAHG
jgi:hypothetical protein